VNKRWTAAVKIFTTGVLVAAFGAGVSGTAHADTGFMLDSFASQKCITVQDPTNAFSPVVQQTCNSALPTQRWHLEAVGSFNKIVSDSNGTCLRSSGNNGSGIFTSPDCSNPPSNLQWSYAVNDPQVTFFAGEFVQRSSGKCIDVPQATTAEGAQLQVFNCNLTTAQIWALIG
jgi:hypothetical protein